ncbi:MAG: VanW family protein [Candidatus Magasanikbacteria bacterium]
MDFLRLKDKVCVLKLRRGWWRFVLITVMITFFVVIIVLGAVKVYTKYYQAQVYPGVYVGSYHLGGMTENELKNLTETLNNRLSKEGLDFKILDKGTVSGTFKMDTLLIEGDSTMELIKLDNERFWMLAQGVGRSGVPGWRSFFAPVWLRFFNSYISAPVIVRDDKILEILSEDLVAFENYPHNANVRVTNLNNAEYDIITEKSGLMFDKQEIVEKINNNIAHLSFFSIVIQPKQFFPDIKAEELNNIKDQLLVVMNYGGLNINFIDPQTQYRRDWNIDPSQLSSWLEATRAEDGKIIFQLQAEAVKSFLVENVSSYIDRPAQDAKFSMVDGKAREFSASQLGQALDVDVTYEAVNHAFIDRNFRPLEPTKTVSAAVVTVEPNIKLASINDFGITDILGVGISAFKDSHNNRIKNIAHAVDRLNGILIKPDEDFSAIKYAGPFTSENGYLPEEVIKGNKIKKEIGGGMCQIGTTLFRMAMNSGMDILERYNHSLVVNYYADPVNGNPGTDAALYEPILDLKFKNDTGAYLLLQAEIDYKRQQLTFTLWGRADGRKGWYTHPIVSKWIPSGSPLPDVETDELKPGERKCQAAFRGAVASFVYTRITSSSEQIERRFESYYRPLPQICMVGKSASSTAAAENTGVSPESTVLQESSIINSSSLEI